MQNGRHDEGNGVSLETRQFFEDPKNISEVRIMQREQGFVDTPDPKKAREDLRALSTQAEQNNDKSVVKPDAFQITIKGNSSTSGVVRRNLETDPTVDQHVSSSVATLIEMAREDPAWSEEPWKVEKMWYDIRFPHPDGSGKLCTAELDIFPELYYMSVAEVEASSETDLAKIDSSRPPWLGRDVTQHSDLKVRNLAGMRDISVLNEQTREAMQQYLYAWLNGLYQPTVLGERINDISSKIRDKSFVVVGSFKQWLPHIRRISRDLARRCKGVYPRISTLDVARRQGSPSNSDFRIEAEIDAGDFTTAENNYVNQIHARDALYVVAPDGRLGGNSGRETIEAFFAGKQIFLSEVINRMASDLEEDIDVQPIIAKLIGKFGRMDPAQQKTVLENDISRFVRECVECTEGEKQRIRSKNMARLLGDKG